MIEEVLKAAAAWDGEHELIVVDGGSRDDTAELAERYGTVLSLPDSHRAARMNAGAAAARGDVFLFHHPRSVLPAEAADVLARGLEDESVVYGGFTHGFDREAWILRFTSWWSNRVRSRRGILYLDHCIFVRRDAFERAGGWPDAPIFEDTIFPKALSRVGRMAVLPASVTTSARRFVDRGLYKHSAVNQFLKLLFVLGVGPDRLNRLYEGKNPFNVRYEDES